MNTEQFIKNNIIKELTKQGASPYNAEQAAERALLEHKRRSDLGKDAFGELLRIASMHAKSFDPTFTYVQPRPKVMTRFKS